jgi:hypothetical protein
MNQLSGRVVMEIGVGGKAIKIDIHCSDDKSRFNPFAHHDESAHACQNEFHKLRDSAVEWVSKNGTKIKQVVEKDESEKIGELSTNAQHFFDIFEHVDPRKRDQFVDFLKDQKDKHEPFEDRVLDFRHEIQDLFKK